MNRYVKWILVALAVLATPILLGIGVLLFTVDDWSRDLSTNQAETSPDTEDEDLRPLQSSLSPRDLADVVESAAATMSHWRQVSRTESGEGIEIKFVRTTGIMQYEDDIQATVNLHENGSVLNVFSISRVGKGDLGQNPRNIAELLSAVRELLAQRSSQRS